MDECVHGDTSEDCIDDVLDRDALGGNASIPYTSIQSSGPPSRPLEFPAPIVDRAITVSADIIDHRTGKVFRASSVLMRRAVHAKTCASRASPANISASFDSNAGRSHSRHYRTNTPDSIHSWHSAFNAPSSSLNSDSPRKQPQHRRVHSNSSKAQKLPCNADCDLPDKAYCVTRKICNTTYGSIRLCVVLKRVSRNVMSPEDRGLRAVERFPAWETTDEMVAIKVANWSKVQSLRGRHLEDPIKELAALQQLLGNYHPNVISILDSLQSETHLYCVFPYIKGGDLYGCVLDEMTSSPTGRLDESQARTWFRQILCAINHLQKKGVCHRDLCLENMMVDENNNIRIIDFGLCLRVPFADQNNRNLVSDVSANTSRRLMKAQGQSGRWEYMAPEVCMRHETFDGFAIDLWAAGIVLFEFLVGKKPFAMPDPVDQNFHTIAVEDKLDWLLQSKEIEVNDEAVDLLQKMLQYDPAKRLTLSEIINHPWVRGKGKKAVPSVEKDGIDSKWFIRSKSIDDTNDAKSADLLLAGLLDSYSRLSSTAESMASTADSSDAESRNPSVQTSSDCSLSNSSHQKPSLELPREAEIDKLDEINTQKKRTWLHFLVKPTSWLRAGK
eukprot:CAMPEP_0172312376 /NCGR_PEP_ID=MMETSP1058-20130122/17263_1 /TAXON_ID=83371 /ORGANISM="Detonula confervacea, Strain CCMP 353" /LENGTH=613 /DNA_ID=CAMNT_0013025809 /DNA_START=255 /DNA_END=2096 /DNA_ORIENTATION=+